MPESVSVGGQEWTKEEILEQAKKRYPKAFPAWLQTLVTMLMTILKSLLPIFMAPIKVKAALPAGGDFEVDPETALFAHLATCVDCKCDEGKVKGPLSDAAIGEALEKIKEVAQITVDTGLDYAVKYAKNVFSLITP